MDYLIVDGPIPNTVRPGGIDEPPQELLVEIQGFWPAANPFWTPKITDSPPPTVQMTARYKFHCTDIYHEYKFVELV
jgi:hypothetical protein